MIVGIGSDLTDIRRIEQAIRKRGFIARVFTKTEQAKANSRSKAGSRAVASTYAKRFAAKEACVKALGKEGLSWLDMEVTNLDSGAPVITLHREARKRLASLTPAKHTARILLTLTDDYPFAQAFVVISAEPK